MFRFLFSSIGQKIQIAFSGFALSVFLLFHLFNNLVLFTGQENFNNMVSFLKSVHLLVRILEFGLVGIILLHIVNAVYSTIKNKRANNGKYAVSANTAPRSSKTMIWSGLVILFFFVIHLRYYWYTFQLLDKDANFYDYMLLNKFGFLGHTPTAVIYIAAILLISTHLKHGFLSIFKTFGVPLKYREGILKYVAALFWAIIPAGFIVVILGIQFGIIN